MDRISSSFFIPRNEQGYESTYKRIRLMPLYSFPHYMELKPHLKNLVPKVFLHIDFDAFYAQVEQRDNPEQYVKRNINIYLRNISNYLFIFISL